jgi:cobaltochelatase CobN
MKIAETFLLDPEMKVWFEKINPWAMEEIGRRLLEAQSRGIWKPDPELLARLRDAYLDSEAKLEETIGDVKGDFQGGAVDVVTADEVESWKSAMEAVMKKAQSK